MLEFQIFQGRREMFRSQKKQFKPDLVKVDNEDQWTKDEKEYLGTELFAILQDRRKQLQETGELEELPHEAQQ